MCVLVAGEVIDAGVLYFSWKINRNMMLPVPPVGEDVTEREREGIEGGEGSNECVKKAESVALNRVC